MVWSFVEAKHPHKVPTSTFPGNTHYSTKNSIEPVMHLSRQNAHSGSKYIQKDTLSHGRRIQIGCTYAHSTFIWAAHLGYVHDRIGTHPLQIEIPFNQWPRPPAPQSSSLNGRLLMVLVEFIRSCNQFLLLEQCKLRQTVTLLLVGL